MKYEALINHPNVHEHMKPTICKSCKADGFTECGVCETCLKNQAYNIEWLETHSFIYDDEPGCYHENSHKYWKCLPLRLPNEHPYLYNGIELEIGFEDDYVYEDDYDDERVMSDYFRETLAEVAKIWDGLFVYEDDSTLTEGYEFISRPMSYAYMTSDEFIAKLSKGLEYLKSRGARVNQPTNHGMHIHLSKKFFEHGNITDAHKAYQNFEWVFSFWQDEMEKLGRRKLTQWCESRKDKFQKQFSHFMSNQGQNPDSGMKGVMRKGNTDIPFDDHSSAVNSDANTIEVRTFKSTIDYKEILASVEIVRNIAHAVRDDDINKSLDEILHTKDNKFLDEYIAKRKLECAKNKDKLSLDKVNNDEIEVDF